MALDPTGVALLCEVHVLLCVSAYISFQSKYQV